MLDHSSISEDPFRPVFLQDHRESFSRFDVVIRYVVVVCLKGTEFEHVRRVDVSSAEMRNASTLSVADHGSAYNALIVTIASTLRRGLGNRAKAIVVLQPSSDIRPLAQAFPASSILHLGIIFDTDYAFCLVDHGRSAEEQDSEQTKAFHNLWGEKAELRRFKDGKIVESVV